MEANPLAPRAAPPATAAILAALRKFVGRWGLIAALAVLPVVYGVLDIVNGYPGFAHGYTLVYGIIELINFAHGDVFMIGSFTAASFWASIGLGLTTGPVGLIVGLLVTLVVSMVVCGSLNVLIERVAYRPLRNAPKLAPLITAVGFSFILQNVGLLWRGGAPQSVNDLIHQGATVFNISGVPIQRGYLLAVAVMLPLVFALAWFISSTRLGRAMR